MRTTKRLKERHFGKTDWKRDHEQEKNILKGDEAFSLY